MSLEEKLTRLYLDFSTAAPPDRAKLLAGVAGLLLNDRAKNGEAGMVDKSQLIF